MPNNEDGTPSTEGVTVETNEVTATTSSTSYTPSYDRDSYYPRNEFDWSLVRSNKSPITSEKWFVNNWRPAMAWLYMAIVAFDFIIAPVMSMIIPVLPWVRVIPYTPWHPLTLEGGGLIHVTFGAVLGITAWGRTKEKIDPSADDKCG